MAGPFLDPLHAQAPYAPELLKLFTDMINSDPAYVARLHRHYVMFKEHCDGRPYAGPPFETPGQGKRIASAEPPMPGRKDRRGPRPATPSVPRGAKLGRNDPCPCGSGKKYKHCCMGSPSSAKASAPTVAPAAATGAPADAPDPQPTPANDTAALDEMGGALVAEVVAWQRSPNHRRPWGPVAQGALESQPDLALALLRLLLNRYAPDGRQETPPEDYGVCLALLEEALTQIRYAVERKRPWALALAEQVQTEIAERAFRPEVDVLVQQDLIQALHNAKIEVHPRIREQATALSEYYARFRSTSGPSDLDKLLEQLIQETGVEEPRDLLELVLAQMEVMPVEAQVLMVAGMMASTQSLFNELAVLLLLHPNALVRARLPEAFRQTEGVRNISAIGLRRLIGLRNWLPPAERPALDALIKQVRLAGHASAALPPGQQTTFYASGFDGSGAQGNWMTAKDGRRYRIDAVLVKQGFGIREVWGQGGFSRREIDTKVKGMTDSAGAVPVHGDLLHRLVAHFIAVGLAHDRPPPPALLLVNELVGGNYWKPQRLACADVVADLLATDPDAFAPPRTRQVLTEAGNWPRSLRLAASWFEDDARVDDLLRRALGPPERWLARLPSASALLVERILEDRRDVWAERLMWTALWARAAQTRPPVPWQSFLIVANALQQGTPLAQIPLMHAVAERSVQSAWQRLTMG
jgi:hypothetical protein